MDKLFKILAYLDEPKYKHSVIVIECEYDRFYELEFISRTVYKPIPVWKISMDQKLTPLDSFSIEIGGVKAYFYTKLKFEQLSFDYLNAHLNEKI